MAVILALGSGQLWFKSQLCHFSALISSSLIVKGGW